jgi:hypothetical protein
LRRGFARTRCGNFPNHREIFPLGIRPGTGDVRDIGQFATGACGTGLALRPVEEISMQQSSVEKFCDWVRLIQSEYVEMPGLHLSKRQAQRLWNLDARSTDMIFDELEASNFLRRMANDMYIRADVSC